MRATLLMILGLSVLWAGVARAAPPAPRPYSGLGILTLRGPSGAGAASLAVYAEPGLQRIAEPASAALPRLAGDPGEPRLAVSANRGRWVRIAYDDAGREGWIEPPRSAEYLTWQEFLPGRTVRVLPGMKKVLYAVRGEAQEAGPETGSLARDQQVRVLQVEGEWARLQAPAGWFRWRDADGRLTVSP